MIKRPKPYFADDDQAMKWDDMEDGDLHVSFGSAMRELITVAFLDPICAPVLKRVNRALLALVERLAAYNANEFDRHGTPPPPDPAITPTTAKGNYPKRQR